MKYGTEIKLMANWTPYPLQYWLRESLPVTDLIVRNGIWRGYSVICICIEANSAEDLWLKRKAFNAMIEAQGYGPVANQK